MLIYAILAIFIVVPVVLHYRTFDIAKGSAQSALLVGLICGLIGFWKEDWVSGVLSFFFATFFEFAIAYAVGRMYRISGSPERAEFVEIASTTPVSEHRLLVGGLGAVAIPLTILATGIAYWWQVGTWDSIPLSHFLGWCILFVFGLATLIGLYLRKRRKSGDASRNAHH
jgi:FtsH-binding integral membrane protein